MTSPDKTLRDSETPRTEAAIRHIGQWGVVYADFSRILERELNAANARVKELEGVQDELFSEIDMLKAKLTRKPRVRSLKASSGG